MKKANTKNAMRPEKEKLRESNGALSHNAFEAEIREKAYLLWEAAGCPPGDGVEFWLQAEADPNRESDLAPSASDRT